MAITFFVDGKRVNSHTPGDLLSADSVTTLHGDDFMQSFGAEMFRRLPLDQQAAVVRAWAEAYSVSSEERREVFEMLIDDIFAAA
jgi:hypothetical protein